MDIKALEQAVRSTPTLAALADKRSDLPDELKDAAKSLSARKRPLIQGVLSPLVGSWY